MGLASFSSYIHHIKYSIASNLSVSRVARAPIFVLVILTNLRYMNINMYEYPCWPEGGTLGKMEPPGFAPPSSFQGTKPSLGCFQDACWLSCCYLTHSDAQRSLPLKLNRICSSQSRPFTKFKTSLVPSFSCLSFAWWKAMTFQNFQQLTFQNFQLSGTDQHQQGRVA